MDDVEPRDLFMRDFVKQCGKWVKGGEQLFIIMDCNDHAVNGELTRSLSTEGIDLEEFSYNFRRTDPPDSHVNGNGPIVAGHKSKGMELPQLVMLPYIDSVGDHRSWVAELTTRSVLCPNLLKTQRSIGRRLITSNEMPVLRFNNIVKV